MEKSVPKCRICNDRHFLKSCPRFLRMSVMKRRDVVKEKGFCFNCLCTSHTRHWCPSRKTCMVCQKNHHTLIHTDATLKNVHRVHGSEPVRDGDKKKQRRPPGSLSSNRASKRSSPPSHSRKPNMEDRLSRRSKTHIFLPTALTRILAQNGPEKTRVLLNSGGTQTVILKDLVDRLNLRSTIKEGKEHCIVNLQSYQDPSAKIQISGVVKRQFNIALPTEVKDEKFKKVYDHLSDLADPNFCSPKNIEIIIGNDQLPRILKAGLIQTSSRMPIAQSTIFGWAISGACQF
ncbi:uncharacterized protein LOC106083504 isoform X2 [Stomoxys calcitrans]|uniref:uncharacterized protein LOC106083504 isoform X2 n=1 Tax=Stomoxys calcitrans TaxID=35570 RepID=UPI0027E3B165|nr:uncharacterized protein LOC106083504 isoform X2 [Stomoxys calcitrans]